MKLFKKRPIFLCLLAVLLVLLVWTLWGNTALTLTEYPVESARLPASFDGFRIAQVSDLHNAEFGSGNKKLLAMLEDSQPDLMAVTGDRLDSRRPDVDVAVEFLRQAVQIAPVYYVPGNHESRIPNDYAELKAAMDALGIVILESKSLLWEQTGESITISGLFDPAFGISTPNPTAEGFHLVLCHRPEIFDWYVRREFDLVLTGHAHGGQFRLPFVGGLYAPEQGFFPVYDSGIYTQGATTMVVSRGLGNSLFPLRFNNRPELILITLESI